MWKGKEDEKKIINDECFLSSRLELEEICIFNIFNECLVRRKGRQKELSHYMIHEKVNLIVFK